MGKEFKFKQFSISQENVKMKIGTDGVLLGAWVGVNNTKSAIDIGTGTGVIALMLAQRAQGILVAGIEIDKESSIEADQNFKNSKWSQQLSIYNTSIQDFANTSNQKFDLIISNPPFFTGGTFSDNEARNSVRHTIKLPTGELLTSAYKLMHKQSRFAVVLPYIEGLQFKEQTEFSSFFCTRICQVKSFKNAPVKRLLLEFSLTQKDCIEEELVIYNTTNTHDYTHDYIQITKEFYLNM